MWFSVFCIACFYYCKSVTSFRKYFCSNIVSFWAAVSEFAKTRYPWFRVSSAIQCPPSCDSGAHLPSLMSRSSVFLTLQGFLLVEQHIAPAPESTMFIQVLRLCLTREFTNFTGSHNLCSSYRRYDDPRLELVPRSVT